METVFVQDTSIAVAYAKNYGKSAAKINSLINELKTSYPYLTDEDIEVDFFNGSAHLNRILHVYAKVSEPAKGYVLVDNRNFFY